MQLPKNMQEKMKQRLDGIMSYGQMTCIDVYGASMFLLVLKDLIKLLAIKKQKCLIE